MKTQQPAAKHPIDTSSVPPPDATSQAPSKPRYLTIGDCAATTPWRSPDNFDLDTPTSVPCLRLSGLWLQKAGFTTGTKVRVEVSRGRLLIEPTPEPPPRTQHPRRIAKPGTAYHRAPRAQLIQPDH